MVLSAFTPLLSMAALALVLAVPVHYPMEIADVNTALLIGVAPLLVVLYLLQRRYRGRPSAARELVFASIGMTAVVPFVTFLVLSVANVALDGSPATTHRVRVLDHYKRNSHTVYVESWTAGVEREKIVVPRSIPVVSKGDVLDVQIRQGGLGWPWVPSVAKR